MSTGGTIAMRARTAMNQNWTPRVSTAPATKHRNGDGVAAREGDRKQELVPGEGERDERGRRDAGGGEGEGDPHEGGPVGAAVDEHRLLELEGEVDEGLAEDDDREGQHEGRVDEDERELGVEEARGCA